MSTFWLIPEGFGPSQHRVGVLPAVIENIKIYTSDLSSWDKKAKPVNVLVKITEIKETTVILEVAKDVNITVDKAGIIKDMSDVQQR